LESVLAIGGTVSEGDDAFDSEGVALSCPSLSGVAAEVASIDAVVAALNVGVGLQAHVFSSFLGFFPSPQTLILLLINGHKIQQSYASGNSTETLLQHKLFQLPHISPPLEIQFVLLKISDALIAPTKQVIIVTKCVNFILFSFLLY
jgi:hypothetical protein